MNVINIEYQDDKQALKLANSARLNYKGEWFQLNISNGENLAQFKCFGTSIQIVQLWGAKFYRDGGVWDLSVKSWKEEILKHIQAIK